MKRLVFIYLVLISYILGLSFTKNSMIIEYNQNDWYQNQFINKLVDLGSYYYDFKLIDAGKTEYLTYNYDFKEEMSYDSNVFLRVTNDSTQNINIYYEIKGKNRRVNYQKKDSADWIEQISVNTLEKISLDRFKYDSSWDTLQLTFYKGVDEYPVKRNDTIVFISDRFKGNREVYYYNLSNESINKILLELSSEYFPDISPNGDYFVFQSSLFGNWDIVLYDKTKNDFTKITDKNYGYSPYFKNENTIVYSEEVDESKEYNRIVEYNIKTKQKKVILEDQKYLKYRPSFYMNSLIFYGINPETAEVKIYKDENGESNQLFQLKRNQMDSWSDNSDKLVFSYNFNSSYDIFFYENNTLINLTKDIKDDTYYQTFSDDGKFVFFSVYYKNKEPDIFIKRIKR